MKFYLSRQPFVPALVMALLVALDAVVRVLTLGRVCSSAPLRFISWHTSRRALRPIKKEDEQ